jgi:hypothetical protein
MLRVEGAVAREDFIALANNRRPGSRAKRLTVGMNKTRLKDVTDRRIGLPVIDPESGDVQKREVAKRRPGYDFTLSAPKSVSLYLKSSLPSR